MRGLWASVVTALLLGGCARPTEPKALEAPTIIGRVEAVTAVPWTSTYTATGSVEAVTKAVLAAQVTGVIGQVSVETGDRVRAGQTLVRLNAAELQSAQAQAEAAQREAMGTIRELDAAIASAKAQEQLAQVTEGRVRELFHKRSVTRQEMDEATAHLQERQAEVRMAEARRQQAESRVAQAGQALRSAETLRGYSVITAPFAGLVVEKQAQVGALASPGMPLLTIEREGAYRVEAAIEESRASGLRVGQTVTVTWDGAPEPIKTKVSEIVPAVDVATRTVVIKAPIPARTGLQSGRFVRVEWPLGETNVIAVPWSAVRQTGQLQLVMVIDNKGVARSRMVTLGERRGEQVQVLAGLSVGEMIVNPLNDGFSDGMRVEVRR